jgi:hypothetical protein
MLTQLKNFIRRTTEGVQNAASLTVDQQYERLDARNKKELEAEEERVRNSFPHGWFKMETRSGITLRHWCADCKTLSEGAVAKHCGSRKQDRRPEGLRLLLLPKSPVAFL